MVNRAIEITGEIIEPVKILPLHIKSFVFGITAQKAVLNSVFQDTIVISTALLLNDTETMTVSK